MDNLEKTTRLKIQDIVEKLQKLECTLLGNKGDTWIMELLFKPGFHRYQLIEWMLSKLGYDIGKLSGPQISAEERIKNLQSTVSNLGLCRQDNHNLIKGTATVEEQVEFWCKLTDIIWLKYQIYINASRSESDEGIGASPEKSKRNYISEEFEEASSNVSKICESVNLKCLFQHDVQLIAPDVQREIRNLSPTKSETFKVIDLEELKGAATANPVGNLKELHNSLLQVSLDKNENDTAEVVLNQLEEELGNVSADLKNIAESSFNEIYADLKPLILHTKAEKFTDVGPGFEKLQPLLESLLQLKYSFPKLESSNSKLQKTISDLEGLISQNTFTDTKYDGSLKLMKEKS